MRLTAAFACYCDSHEMSVFKYKPLENYLCVGSDYSFCYFSYFPVKIGTTILLLVIHS